ncbi:MAG: DNA translocase FtsK [Clostridia bacterium]|nr:DNA translocase FtsK [Clostridia bacterium]
MGRKKGSKNRRNKKNNKTIGGDFLGGILIVLAFVTFVLFKFKNVGVIGDGINEIFAGLLGDMRIFIPVVFAFIGVRMIVSAEKIKVTGEIIKGLVVVILTGATVYAFKYSTNDYYALSTGVIEFLEWGYTSGVDASNISGILGALIANVINLIGGIYVARIILVSATLLFTLYFIHLGFMEFISIIYNGVVAVIEFIANAFVTVFSKDEEKENQREEKKKAKLEEKRQEREQQLLKEKEARLASLGTRNYAENIKNDEDDQLRINLNTPAEEKTQNEKFDAFFKKQRETNEEKNVKEVLQLEHSTHENETLNYTFPPLSLLAEPKAGAKGMSKKAVDAVADKLEKTLASFGVEAKVTHITKGPTVMCYELTPAAGVKVSKIVNLADDIALNLAAKSIRIEAPIPGKGTVGIEVPNETKEAVSIREVIASDKFVNCESKLAFALGKDTAGDIAIGDIAKMPHVLVAGATGSGKSVCINAMLISILYKAKPSEVKLILIDPKMVEMSAYNGIPHLLIPVVTDPKKAAGALNWAVTEMVDRYTKFAAKGVKDIKGYNKVMEKEDEGKKLPQIVIVIDELSDLMMAAPNDVEDAICRLAQMARAAGMYLVIATQRPSVDVITGVIKANIPSRIAFTVSSQIDSRTILDMSGAEKLLGKGDMLYYPTGEIKPLRMQGAFVSEKEVEDIVTYIKGNCNAKYSEDIINKIENQGKTADVNDGEIEEEVDSLLDAAIDLVVDMGTASASMLQRRFKIGYSRAGRMIDQMEARGIVSGSAGSKPRQVLVSKEEWQQVKFGTPQVVEENVSLRSADEIPSMNSSFQIQNEQKPQEQASSVYDTMLMERLKRNIAMDSMFYDEDENSPNNT